MEKKHVGWLDLPQDRILATALDVRCDYALAKVVLKCGLDTEVPGADLLDAAIGEARSVGVRDANRINVPDTGATMPAYFADEPALMDAWTRGAQSVGRQAYEADHFAAECGDQ